MDAVGLLLAIRARAAAREMTLADLARSAGMQPSNLRRMLTHPSATSRLGTVMRLLPPLGCHVAPPGVATAAELVAFLGEQGRRRGLSWDALLGEAVAAHARTAPERLPLEVVMRVASALNVELTLADGAHADASGDSPNRRPASSSPTAVASSPRGRAASSTRLTSSARSTRSARTTPRRAVRPPDAAAAPERDASSPPPASSPASPPAQTVSQPRPSADASSPTTPSADQHRLGPLRPPRLGRYRDTPPEPPRPRPPPPPWIPREQGSAIDGAVAQQLAEFSGDDWRDIYMLAWSMFSGAASLPARMLERLGHWTAARLTRLRRAHTPPVSPELPEPPEGWFDEHDLRALMFHWNAARAPGYKPSGIIVQRNEHGLFVGHLSLDDDTMAVIQPAPRGRPHSLANLVQPLPGGGFRSWLTKEVPLEIMIGDERHLFRHVRAGPIFGELALGDRTLLLAAMSVFLVLVEVRGEDATVVWGGPGEMLPTLALEAPLPGKPPPEAAAPQGPEAGPLPPASQAPAEDDERRRRRAEEAHAAAVQALEATGRALDDERRCRGAAEQALVVAVQALESRSRELDDEQHRRHDAEQAHAATKQALEIMSHELDDERQRRHAAEQERTAATAVLDLAAHAALVLQAEMKAQSEARGRSDGEARKATAMLGLVMDALEVHVQGGDLAAWRKERLAALVAEERPEAGSLEPNEVERFLDQLCDVFDMASRRERLERELTHAGHAAAEPAFSDGIGAPVDGEVVPTPSPEERVQVASAADGAASVATLAETAGVVATPPTMAASDPPHAEQATRRRMSRAYPWPNLGVEADAVRESPRTAPKVGRNDPCPCGSGKKLKKCCWRSAT